MLIILLFSATGDYKNCMSYVFLIANIHNCHQESAMGVYLYVLLYFISELFLVQRLWYVLFCLWDGAYKRTLAVNRKD